MQESLNLSPSSLLPSLNRRDALRTMGLGSLGLFLGTRLWSAEPEVSTLPTLSGGQPGYYRFKVGDLEAIALNDGGFAVPTEQSPFGIGESVDAKRQTLEQAFSSPDTIRMTFNNLLIRIGGELILVDSGAGNLYGPAGGKLIANLAAVGVNPESVTGIILTHLHGDHFGGLLNAAGAPAFPNAKLFIHKREYTFWSGSEADTLAAGAVANARKYLQAFEGQWQLIAGGDLLVGGLEIMESFGHTPGHITIRIQSGNEQLYHMVDIAHHHALSFAHPEWKLGWDVQPEVAIKTRFDFMKKASEARTRVMGAHMPFPSLGHIRKAGNAYEYVIEPWVVG